MYITLTLPHFYPQEAEAITLRFQAGLQLLHLRKPDSRMEDVRRLLQDIPACYHSRIVIHEHFQLLQEFALRGVHLNRRCPEPPQGWTGHISTSCHTLDELAEKTPHHTYCSLSPIFDSISKQGYHAAFTPEQLHEAHRQGIVTTRVMALGGICADNVDEALQYGFGGVMVLGDAWKSQDKPIVLSIAGSDPSAGAGIQQDLKTITRCGGYGATVITALTSQNTLGVQDVMPVPAEVVASQLRSVLSDLRVDAVKIGMVPNAEVLRAVVDQLRQQRRRRILPIILDPIMISTSGRRLMEEQCVREMVDTLFPLCTLVTPNLPEYEALPSLHVPLGQLPTNILVKGGHAEGSEMTDTLLLRDEQRTESFTSPRIATTNLHGTGCTLSSAIASQLSQGDSLVPAVRAAKAYMDEAIQGGASLHIGRGNGPLWHE